MEKEILRSSEKKPGRTLVEVEPLKSSERQPPKITEITPPHLQIHQEDPEEHLIPPQDQPIELAPQKEDNPYKDNELEVKKESPVSEAVLTELSKKDFVIPMVVLVGITGMLLIYLAHK